MNKKLTAAACILAAAMAGAAVFGACSAKGSYPFAPGDGDASADMNGFVFTKPSGGEADNNYQYDSVIEQDFRSTSEENASYFSLDRNTAGYSLVRAQINAGQRIAGDSVRVEEMINYFSYGYSAPVAGEGFKATAYLTDCPWTAGNKLLTVGMRTEEVVTAAECNNYVFLIDVSGSMSSSVWGTEGQTCLSLAKYGIGKLVEGLNANDTVSVVTYASGVGTELNPTHADEAGKKKIMKAVNGLRAYGATNASGGIQLAYANAAKNYSQTGNNRVILISDGDFNVGVTNQSDLKEFIQEKAKSGIYLSVLGVGMGNMRDDFMQTLALNGNGNYAYIDTAAEAEKVLCEELQGMLTVVAKDAKAKVEFNKETVEKYRLIGYDMKVMSEEDFEDSKKDAGEIGSNLCVTALYELKLKDDTAADAPVGDICVRFKSPAAEEEKEVNCSVTNQISDSSDVAFVACVAEFGLILRGSQHRGNASLQAVTSRLADLGAYLERDAYKSEFRALVQKADASGFYGK